MMNKYWIGILKNDGCRLKKKHDFITSHAIYLSSFAPFHGPLYGLGFNSNHVEAGSAWHVLPSKLICDLVIPFRTGYGSRNFFNLFFLMFVSPDEAAKQ